MSELCEWLHKQLEQLPLFVFPFILEDLPPNGIYFLYEKDEKGHNDKPRIVRIGTHRNGNFRARIAEHYLLKEGKMNFGINSAKPSDRSIFRKNIGRALLSQNKDDYLKIWEYDFISSKNKIKYGYFRDIIKEKAIEEKITKIIQENFSFRFIKIDEQKKRMGTEGLESSLIGTVSHCKICKPSKNWLGNFSPKKQIRESGLWLIQHLKTNPINEDNKKTIKKSIYNIHLSIK